MNALPDATRHRLAEWRADHDARFRRRAEIQALPGRERAALIEAGRHILDDASPDRPHLDAMPGMRNRIAAALHSAAPDDPYLLPCRDRVLPGDRIRCTVRAGSDYGFSTGGKAVCIEGEVVAAWADYLATVRITACADAHGPSPGTAMRLRMEELLEYGCMRMVSADEETRTRTEADIRRTLARARERTAEQLRERDRRRARGIDRGIGL